MKRFDILVLGSTPYRRRGWFWVPMDSDDLRALDAADGRDERRETIGWALTFTLAALAFLSAIIKHALVG